MTTYINLKCKLCNRNFDRAIGVHNRTLKRGQTEYYCSKECSKNGRTKKETYRCRECNKEVSRTPSQIENNIFCSKTCAAVFNNKIRERKSRAKKHKCTICFVELNSKRKYCNDCFKEHRYKNKKTKDWSIVTIQELEYKNKPYKYVRIRDHARSVTKDREQKCQKCGYDKYVECCHIKAIKEFDKKTKLSEVNHPNNLVLLCPNCHKEMDLGLSPA